MSLILSIRLLRPAFGCNVKNVQNKMFPFILTQADHWECKEEDNVQLRSQHTLIQEDELGHVGQVLDFENHREAFKDRSTWDICKSLTILRMCGIEAFARNSLKVSEKYKIKFEIESVA